MRFTFTVYKDDGSQEKPVRQDIFTRHEEIKPEMYTWPYYINVYDNQTSKDYCTIKSEEDLVGFYEARARALAWRPIPKWDPLNSQETDIQLKTKPNLPDNNLKTAVAMGKPGITAVPPVALFALGAAMQDGVNKYEKYNWREAGATVSIFVDAMARHLFAYYSGEDHASDSKIHHLAHLMAGSAILLDAELHGKLNDDRMAGEIKPEIIKQFMQLIKKD